MNGATNEAAMSFRIYKSEKTSLSRIGGWDPGLVAAQAWAGFTTKATTSFRMNRIAFDTVRYCGLGRS